jgi:guanylate kinase
VSIFILPPGRQQLEWRLRNRGEDSETEICRRLDTARREIEQYSKYDYILVNDKIEQAIDELKAIVLAERIRCSGKQPSEQETKLLATAQECRLERAQDRVRPILDSFATKR